MENQLQCAQTTIHKQSGQTKTPIAHGTRFGGSRVQRFKELNRLSDVLSMFSPTLALHAGWWILCWPANHSHLQQPMDWCDLIPKVKSVKKVVIRSASINAIWYLMHVPLLYYIFHAFFNEKQHTTIISNSPFLLLEVDFDRWLPDILATISVDPTGALGSDSTIATWCAAAGGPFSCKNSTPEVFQQCAAGLCRMLCFFSCRRRRCCCFV